jgi:bacteriocin biosynthesis cyclodehydratase domain-containing protein
MTQTGEIELDNLPERPLLSGLYYVIPEDGNGVRLANAGRSFVLSAGDRWDDMVCILESLDGTVTAAELDARFPDLARRVLGALDSKGLLLDGAVSRSPLGVGLGSTFGCPVRGRPLDTLLATVVGCGPIGATVAILLARAGIGRLLLVDSATQTERDACMSPLVMSTEPGGPRSRAVLATCEGMGRARDQWILELSADQLTGSDVVVIEMGYDTSSIDAANACLAGGRPYVTVSQDALNGLVASFAPGGHPCHHCLQARCLSHRSDGDFYGIYHEHRSRTHPEPDTYVPSHAAIVAGVAATAALRNVVGPTAHGPAPVAVIDLDSCEIRREVLLPVPGCRHCDNVDHLRA